MKINKFFTLTVFSIVLISCGGDASNENENAELTDLIAERDSLKDRLTVINAQIAELDTASRVVNPIVSAQAVVIKKFEHKIEVQGAVETDENAMINAEASGKVTKVHVEEGQKVSAGQALVTIDATILSSQIQEMETQLELATYMYEKQKKLMDEGVGTEIDYEQAKAQKNSLEKSIQTMRSQQGKTVVRAPFSGVVDQVMIHMGEMAAPGVPLLRIVNNRDVKITASLSENYLSKVFEGTEVQLSVPSLNDTIIYSKISSKGNFIDPVNRTFRIRIDIKNNKLLLPNQLAKVQVTDFEQDSATVVNSQSILQDTQNNNYIYKLKKTKGDMFNVEKVFVEVLSQYNGEACVIPINGGNIKEGDQIVVNGAKGITEADQVIIQ
ncbi:MAG: efflux RND transporter periplasmic adaptor subunit [Crocinitomicaceae bacterium]|nr:efflux RND transporter periplasmic adaptor subunit [Crocinitomicaceae bacterium]